MCRDTTKVVKRTSNSAYPKVVSNLGSLSDKGETMVALNMIRFMNHYARNVSERTKIIKFFNDNKYVPPAIFAPADDGASARTELTGTDACFSNNAGEIGTKTYLRYMNDHFAVGFANTLGYAHANSGDTMTSVMIGGLRTVMNGDFEIFAGDLVQFYWSFERDDFEQDGRRKAYTNIWDGDIPCNVNPSITKKGSGRKRDMNGNEVGPTWQTPADAQVRQAHYDLSYGQRRDRQKIVAKIKPYFRDDEHPRLMDWYRVFGIAIASARPNEMCDIKISRQSM